MKSDTFSFAGYNVRQHYDGRLLEALPHMQYNVRTSTEISCAGTYMCSYINATFLHFATRFSSLLMTI